jgi:hypothetical protein
VSNAITEKSADAHIIVFHIDARTNAYPRLSTGRNVGIATILDLAASSRMVNGTRFANEADNVLIQQTLERFEYDIDESIGH